LDEASAGTERKITDKRVILDQWEFASLFDMDLTNRPTVHQTRLFGVSIPLSKEIGAVNESFLLATLCNERWEAIGGSEFPFR
jgi:hypothetical protein